MGDTISDSDSNIKMVKTTNAITTNMNEGTNACNIENLLAVFALFVAFCWLITAVELFDETFVMDKGILWEVFINRCPMRFSVRLVKPLSDDEWSNESRK